MAIAPKPSVEISGAGPAGLAAGLAVAHAGRAAFYERREEVGKRFHGDFQGIENWTTDSDVLDELGLLGIESRFEHTPFREVTCFSPDGIPREFRSEKPLFYLIRRGSEPGTTPLHYGATSRCYKCTKTVTVPGTAANDR